MSQLGFGYNQGVPEGATAAWGVRLIARQDGVLDFVPNRQDMWAEGKTNDEAWAEPNKLLDYVRANYSRAAENATALLKSYRMKTRESEAFLLYADKTGAFIGNTNASAGYLYVCGFLWADAGIDTSTVAAFDEAIDGLGVTALQGVAV